MVSSHVQGERVVSGMKTIRVGLIGGGVMAKAHSLAYENLHLYYSPKLPEIERVRLAEVDEQLARTGAERFGWSDWTTNWRDIVDDPTIDAVDIVTPNDLHAPIAIAAARAGKHVLCEKPLARTGPEAREMVDAAKQAGVKAMVGYNYRKVPAVAYARELIAMGKLGRILSFRGYYLQDWGLEPSGPLTWRFQAGRAGTGSLGDIGAHVIDMARFLVGEVESVSGLLETFVKHRPLPESRPIPGDGRLADGALSLGVVDVDDVATVLLRFDNGATGLIDATRLAPGRKNHLAWEINGDRGSLAFNWERSNELHYYAPDEDPRAEGFRTILTGPLHPNGAELWPLAGFGTGYLESTLILLRDFFWSIADGSPVAPDFEDGWRICEIMDAIVRSSHERRWVSATSS
jgi:predicted dehydrogenase